MRISILSTIGCILLTPFVLLTIIFLACLAVITTTFTSSFLFLRLALLTIEVISGLTLESTNWLLNNCMLRIKGYLNNYKSHHKKQPTQMSSTDSIIMRRKKLSTSSLSLSRLPYKAKVKSKYSVSVPGTPDPESFHHQMAM
ncbi:uncharacterized protein B0P05DRAFT_521165 [Gilbertella persicaria]|uniref:uncharacterized protein n=1 Tax=Gilbertella persicaria TaxID=101096 RepID=UPI00221E75B4|nr:uncharacterized protein B0P05DRAFT_521165 [Gilbertella persicaria]KAI8098273.1 hypothetical protein B0P05DRAFT_521165 [Gilbertella persicaria]